MEKLRNYMQELGYLETCIEEVIMQLILNKNININGKIVKPVESSNYKIFKG